MSIQYNRPYYKILFIEVDVKMWRSGYMWRFETVAYRDTADPVTESSHVKIFFTFNVTCLLSTVNIDTESDLNNI